MDKNTKTISYRDFQRIRYYLGSMANDIDNMSDDSADSLHKLCDIIYDYS